MLHIIRNFHDVNKAGVYDMAYSEEGTERSGPTNRIRRFFGEQELTEFLKKHLNQSPEDVQKMMHELQQSGRTRIPDISLPDELRDLAA